MIVVLSALFITLRKFQLKKYFLVIYEILRTLVNTLTPDGNYFLCNRENSRQPIEMELTNKLKNYSQFSTAFLKSTFNFQYFAKKY